MERAEVLRMLLRHTAAAETMRGVESESLKDYAEAERRFCTAAAEKVWSLADDDHFKANFGNWINSRFNTCYAAAFDAHGETGDTVALFQCDIAMNWLNHLRYD